MKRSDQYTIQIKGRTYRLLSRYFIPDYLATEYCNNHSVLTYPGGEVRLTPATICFLCDRPFHQATRQCPMLCPNLNINHKLGYVGRICSDCLYYLERLDGYDAVPISVKKVLDAGFTPINLKHYM